MNASVYGSNFTGNVAENGGAVSTGGQYSTFDYCVFKNNRAVNGGAIYVNGHNISVRGCTFKNNTAGNGSSIFVVNYKSGFEIKNSIFKENNATEHGTIYLTGATNLRIGNNTFINNYPHGIIENYYILADGSYKASLVYVNSIGGGSGLTEDSPISISKVWDIIENNGMIVFLNGEYEISKTISQNYTIVGRSGVTLKRSNDKYLFILPIIQKYIKKKQIVF